MLGFPERIDEIRDEIFFFGTFFKSFLFVFDDDFVIGDFDNLFAGDDEVGVDEGLHGWALDDDLLDDEILCCNGVINDSAKLVVFLGFDFETYKVKIKV